MSRPDAPATPGDRTGRHPGRRGRGRQSGWRDLNPRPLAPKASALPSCATPRGDEQSMPSPRLRRCRGIPHPDKALKTPRTAPPRKGQRCDAAPGTTRHRGAVARLHVGHEHWVRCLRAPCERGARGRSSMVELQSSKLTTRVRFSSPAPRMKAQVDRTIAAPGPLHFSPSVGAVHDSLPIPAAGRMRSAWDVLVCRVDQQAEAHRHPLVTRQAEHFVVDREIIEGDP